MEVATLLFMVRIAKMNGRKLHKIPARIVCKQAEIWIQDFPNTEQEKWLPVVTRKGVGRLAVHIC
jgi:hypothetical protein